jgi:hypothetical protein
MNSAPGTGAYNGSHLVLQNQDMNKYSGSDIDNLVSSPDTSSWYKTQYGCLRTDPTAIARRHTFPDAVLPRGVPQTAAPLYAGCMMYATAWPEEAVDAEPMVLTEQEHPQFAFSPGGPGTAYQIDVESQLRRLDQPLTNCQAVIAADAPLYRNTVAPPRPMNVPIGPQNAANPLAAIVRPVGEADCRVAADAVATAMSGRWLNNPTRQDTMRFAKPFEPPGVGTGAARGPVAVSSSAPYYA